MKVRYFAYMWGQVRGLRHRIMFTARLAAAQLAPGLIRRSHRLATVSVPLRDFDLVFRISRGELLPYRQIEQDFERAVIPHGPDIRDWIIIDCGANIGLFSLFLRAARHIIAIEPNPECCERLAQNLERNHVPGVIVPKAVSDNAEPVRMTFTDRTTVLSRISPEGQVEVEATTIDAVVAEQELSRVDLLKLDVEGHEIEALRGAAQSLSSGLIKRLYIEYHGEDELRSLDEFLDAFGYKRRSEGHLNALYEHHAPLRADHSGAAV